MNIIEVTSKQTSSCKVNEEKIGKSEILSSKQSVQRDPSTNSSWKEDYFGNTIKCLVRECPKQEKT